MNEIILNVEQQNAFLKMKSFLNNNERYMVLTGGGGTGKTTITDQFVKYCAEGGIEISITATTNKAAGILKSATTVHKKLNLRVVNNYDNGNVFLAKGDGKEGKGVLIIDESSMINESLLKLIESSGFQKIIFIGDKYQLNPVNENVSPAMNSGEIVTLKISMRTKSKEILSQAHKWIKAQDKDIFPIIESGKDFVIMSEKEFVKEIKQNFFNEGDNICLAYTNKRVDFYNRKIKRIKYDSNDIMVGETLVSNDYIKQDGNTIYVGDKVTVDSVEHGECLFIEGYNIIADGMKLFVAKDRKEVEIMLANEANKAGINQKKGVKGAWKDFFETKNLFNDLRPPYSSTVHKSQGSSYDTVYIDVPDIFKNKDRKELFRLMYVAITRAKNKVVLIKQNNIMVN